MLPRYVHGPLVIEQMPLTGRGRCKSVYIVGENHSLHAECVKKIPSSSFIDAVMDSYETSSKQMAIMYEESFRGVQNRCDKMPNPSMLCELTKRFQSRKIPNNIKLFFGDARFEHPFELVTSLYSNEFVASNIYFSNFALHSFTDFFTFKNHVYAISKQLEHTIVQHTRHRKEIGKFIKSLLFPDRKLPRWYADFVSKLYMSDDTFKAFGVGVGGIETSVLKNMLQTLKNTNQTAYTDLVQYVDDMIDKMLKNNREYSRFMDRVNKHIRIDSPHLEFEKSRLVNKFMTLLFSVVQDVYMLTHYFLNRDKFDSYMFIVGAVHGQNMSQFLSRHERSSSFVYRSDVTGCIDTHATKTGPQNFAEFDQMASAEKYLKYF